MIDSLSIIRPGRGIAIPGFERRASLENPRTPLGAPDEWLWDALGVVKTDSGVRVTPTAAMTLSAFWACVRIIAETVASLPLFPYRRLMPRGKERAADHPTYRVLHDQPNPLMTSMVFREAVQVQILLHGNGYAEIVRDGGGQIAELWPLPSIAITPRAVDARTLIYEAVTPHGKVVLQPEEILHIPGLGFDGISGLSPVRMARQAIGMGLAADAFGASFFGNAMRPSGIVESPGSANQSPEQIAETIKSLEALYTGKGKTGRIAMLLGGLTWKSLSIPPNDAQFLETRAFQVREMGRIFRVFGPMLGEDDKSATYAAVEQFNIMSVVHTFRPWLVRWEQELNRKLFTAEEQKSLFAEHVIDGLLRGDIKTRSEALRIQLDRGVISQDDWNEIENRNPLPDGQGQHFWMPLNFETIKNRIAAPPQASGAAPVVTAPGGPGGTMNMNSLLATFAPLFRDADGRWLAREEKNRTPEMARRIYLPILSSLVLAIRGSAPTKEDEALCLGPRAQLLSAASDKTRLIQEFSEVFNHAAQS